MIQWENTAESSRISLNHNSQDIYNVLQFQKPSTCCSIQLDSQEANYNCPIVMERRGARLKSLINRKSAEQLLLRTSTVVSRLVKILFYGGRGNEW